MRGGRLRWRTSPRSCSRASPYNIPYTLQHNKEIDKWSSTGPSEAHEWRSLHFYFYFHFCSIISLNRHGVRCLRGRLLSFLRGVLRRGHPLHLCCQPLRIRREPERKGLGCVPGERGRGPRGPVFRNSRFSRGPDSRIFRNGRCVSFTPTNRQASKFSGN